MESEVHIIAKYVCQANRKRAIVSSRQVEVVRHVLAENHYRSCSWPPFRQEVINAED